MTLIVSTQIASTLLTLFIAISLLSTRALNPLCARILGANYLLSSVQHLLAVVVFSETWPQVSVIRAHLAMFLGPALFLYFSTVLGHKALKQQVLLHFLIPLPLMASAIFSPYGFIADFLIIGSFFGYFSYILFQYRNSLSKSAPTKAANTLALRWLGLLLCVLLINLVVESGIVFEMLLGTPARETFSLKVGSLFFLGFHIFALILVLTRAPLLEWMHELKELSIQKTKPPQLSDKELQAIFTRWEELVTAKELFLSENGITISRAAKLLGIPSRQLSQAINTTYGASFSQYINDKRVERAKALLQENAGMPITEVYLSAGFSTKSHFHREFSRSTGMTPSEFRKKNKF